MSSSIICLADRRVDQAGANPLRFPSGNVDLATGRFAGLFGSGVAVALVYSAACGADIIAFEQAERQRIRFHVVLPFERSKRVMIDSSSRLVRRRLQDLSPLAVRGVLMIAGSRSDFDLSYF